MNIHSENLPKHVQSYLTKFGYSQWKIENEDDKLYDYIIVIPAIQEFENIKLLLKSMSGLDNTYLYSTLVLFVINNLSSSSVEVKEENKKTLQYLRSIISHAERVPTLNIAFVDACSSGLEMPEKEGGVGLARKIGMDLALTKFNYNSPNKKLLICLDADCTVMPDYLTSLVSEADKKNICAGYLEYEHTVKEKPASPKFPHLKTDQEFIPNDAKQSGEEDERKAIVVYEIFLRYYVLGLKYANSPLAFDTVGSTMFCDVEHYVKIGGMNKKKAAEDFYFLEKLAKITSIHKINATKVFPSSRRSWRVPFGTGQRVNRFFAGTHDEYVLINPKCFYILKDWLAIFNTENILNADEYLFNAGKINPALQQFLNENNFRSAWNKIVADSKKEKQINRQKNIWFDGFRTMKLIHFLRDNSFQNINMFNALDEILSHFKITIERNEDIPNLEKQIEYLTALRNL